MITIPLLVEDGVFTILHDELCPSLKRASEFEPASVALSDDRPRRDRPAPDQDSVAFLFRRERIVRMRRLSEIADELKIREFYLQALEDGAFEDLPEGTYACGFVRAYADLLGLDSAEIVARFRAERGDGSAIAPPPAFLSENREARAPSGTIVLLSLLLVASTYAGWLYRSGGDDSPALWDREAPAPSSVLLDRE
jgi:cytoskeleton protein RodZ